LERSFLLTPNSSRLATKRAFFSSQVFSRVGINSFKDLLEQFFAINMY